LSHPARVHGSFRAAVSEPHHLDRITRANFLRQLQLHAVGHAKRCAAVGNVFHCFHYRRVTVPRHQRPKAQVVVNVLVAVDIRNLAAVSFGNKNWIRIIRPVIARNAQGYPFLRLAVGFSGFRRALLV
jgi:hypothetical protein